MSFDFSKAGQSFDTLPYKQRIKSVFELGKSTFTIIGKDDDIIKPWIRMTIYHTVMITFFFGAFFIWQYDQIGYSLLLYFMAFLLFLHKHFYDNKQEMRMSWIVYETVIGNDPSYKGAVTAVKEFKWHIRKIAGIDILMSFIDKSKFSGGSFIRSIINLFISGLEEVWDLANHYLLPSVAVDKLHITEAIKEMKKLKDRVPESLVGIFGIDFLGRVVRQITTPTYILLFLVSVALGYYASPIFPSTILEIFGDNITFSYVPVILALWIGKLFSNFFERTVTAIKVTYFTVFYTKITHPNRIREDMRGELVDYLNLEPVDEVDNLEGQGVETD